MSAPPRSRSFVLAVFLASGLFPAAAHACAACGCGDPSVSEIGIPDTDRGGVIAGVGLDLRHDVSGGDRIDEARTSLVGIWTLTPELQLYGRLPWSHRTVGSRELSGLADAEIGAHLVLARRAGLSHGQSITLQTQLTLPSGVRHGSDLDFATGNGAATTQFGLGWFAHRREWRYYASAAWRHALAPAPEFTPGDVRLANAGVQRPFGERIDGTLEINARDASRDRWPLGTPVPDTGGTVAYLTPGFLATLGPVERKWFVRASVQIPVFRSVYGNQVPGPVLQAGFFKSF